MLILPDQFDSDSNSTMSESNSLWITICCSFAVQACISACYKYIDTNYGKDLRIHAAYLAVAICSVAFIPVNVASYIFTSLTVTFVGYVVMRSVYAVSLESLLCYVISLIRCTIFADAFIPFTGPRKQYVRQMTKTTRNGYNIG
jgi:hypothetical protein